MYPRSMSPRGTHAGGGPSRLGADEMDLRYGDDPEIRQNHSFECQCGRTVSLTFHITAVVPKAWRCSHCGAMAPIIGKHGKGEVPIEEENPHAPAREGSWYTVAHRRSVYGRRSQSDLENLLEERLALLRRASA